MNRLPLPQLLRLCLTFLSVLAMLSATAAQASMVPTLLTEMVICSEGEAKSVYLDADGIEHPAPHDCRVCPACNLPCVASTGKSPALPAPAAWFAAVYPTRGDSAHLSRPRATTQARAPPATNSLNDLPIALEPQAAGGFGAAYSPALRQNDAVVSGIIVRTAAA